MSELRVDEATAAYVRARASADGMSESQWLAARFRALLVAESAEQHARWYVEHPGALEDEVREAQEAAAEADAA